MSDAEADPEDEFVLVRVPESFTSEDVEAVAEAVDEVLPEDMESLVLGGGVKTLSREELVNVLEDTVAAVKGEHRLAGAEPAEQPADPPWEDEEDA